MSICIREKEGKVEPYRERYARWWLVLIDTIFGMKPRELQELKPMVPNSTVFERVIVLDYESGRLLFEI